MSRATSAELTQLTDNRAEEINAELDHLIRECRVAFLIGKGPAPLSTSRLLVTGLPPLQLGLTREEASAVGRIFPDLDRLVSREHDLVEWARKMSDAGYAVFLRRVDADPEQIMINVYDRRKGLTSENFPVAEPGRYRLSLPWRAEAADFSTPDQSAGLEEDA